MPQGYQYQFSTHTNGRIVIADRAVEHKVIYERAGNKGLKPSGVEENIYTKLYTNIHSGSD